MPHTNMSVERTHAEKKHKRTWKTWKLTLIVPVRFSNPAGSTQAGWWVGIPCAVAKIDRHVCVCACVCGVSVRAHACVCMFEGVLTPSVPWPQALTHPPNRKGSSQQHWISPEPWGETWHYLGQCFCTTYCKNQNGSVWLHDTHAFLTGSSVIGCYYYGTPFFFLIWFGYGYIYRERKWCGRGRTFIACQQSLC